MERQDSLETPEVKIEIDVADEESQHTSSIGGKSMYYCIVQYALYLFCNCS